VVRSAGILPRRGDEYEASALIPSCRVEFANIIPRAFGWNQEFARIGRSLAYLDEADFKTRPQLCL